MTTIWQDIRYALRMLRKSPGFTAIAMVTLAIGIGANTTMFSIADMLLLLAPRKVRNPEQLAYCTTRGANLDSFRYSAYVTIRDSGLAFSDLMAQSGYVGGRTTVVHADSAWEVRPRYVSANYFSFLGVAPALGRGFLPEEERQGSAPVVVLGHRLWQRLGSNPKIVGGSLMVNAVPCQVVGVAPEGFTGASLLGPDLWLSLGSYRVVCTWYRDRSRPNGASADWDYPWCDVIGRLKPEVDMSAAQMQLQSLAPYFQAQYPEQWREGTSFSLRPPGRFEIDIDSEESHLIFTVFSLVLMGASAIILVIACLNLANMLMVQGASRRREIAVRSALGGGRWRIVRQLFTESLLLSLLGGAFGVLLAVGGMRVFNACMTTIPDSQAPLRDLHVALNVRVLAATLSLCLPATLLFGLRPALWLSKRNISGEMKASVGGMLGALRRRRNALSVTGQIALAVALVLSAALLTRSALQVAQPDTRFCLEDKLIVQIDPLSAGYGRVRGVQACEALADHLASLPQVRALGTMSRLFYGGGGPVTIREYLPGYGKAETGRPLARKNALIDVGRDYFTALEIPLLRGRLFDQRDALPEAEKVAIIDESAARKLRPGGNVLDCLIQWSIPEAGELEVDPYRVVGIVANVPGVRDREVHGQMYVPTQSGQLSSYLCLHVAGRESVEVLRRHIALEMRRVEPGMSVLSLATLAEIRHDSHNMWLARFGARLGLAAGAAALFLAALGIYAIKGYTVASRTSELGIRKALGATHGSIMGMVLREGLLLTMMGLIVGLALGLTVAKVAARLLYGVSPVDPASVIVTVVLLGAVSLLASYFPARRAAKIDPMVALRCE